MSVAYRTTTGNHETVEELIRYAAREFDTFGIAFQPAKMSKIIRREYRASGPAEIRSLIDTYVDRQHDRLTWAGFELFVNGYADPTGAHAARNVDLERSGVARG